MTWYSMANTDSADSTEGTDGTDNTDISSNTSTPTGFFDWALAFSGNYYDDNYPAGRCTFLHILFNGLYLEHPFIVLPTRKAIFKLTLWAKKTVRSITSPGRSYRGGRRK